jgi:cell division protein FtsQ
MLSDTTIQSLVPLEYPQSLLEIEPENIVRSLTEHPPIMAAQVRRKLFPPGLDITLQERQPVAVTIPSRGETADNPDAAPTPNHQPGFVDAEGYWIPQTSKQELDPNFQPPSLRVRGYHSRYQSQWPSLYAALQASPVAVTEIDWRSLNNLILNTDLGLIHCGVYTPDRFPQQLTTLEKLHDLKTLQPAPKIEYIDLSNPETPALKIVPGSFPRPEADKPDG